MVSLTTAEQVMAIREGGWTERVHTVLKHRPYPVDGHSWGVAMLAWKLFPDDCTKELLLGCMVHDVPERIVGDSPHPAKYPLTQGRLGALLHEAEAPVIEAFGIGIDLSDRERQILAICDLLDFVLWARQEVHMGNTIMKGALEHGMRGLRAMPLWSEIEQIFIEMMAVPYSEATHWWKEMMNVQE